MRYYKKILLLTLMAALMLSALTGCLQRKKTAYQDYMQNVLDVNYKGDFDGYVKDDGGSEEEAAAMYGDSISYLASQLINHYSLANAESDTVTDIFSETAKTIYSKSKYEVSQAYKSGEDYYVDITVYPMDILNQAFDEVLAYTDEYNQKVANGDYNDTAKEDYEAEFAQGVSDILTAKSADMEYLSPVVVSVKIVDDGDYYSVDSSDLAKVDATMLAIEGSPESSETTESESTTEGN